MWLSPSRAQREERAVRRRRSRRLLTVGVAAGVSVVVVLGASFAVGRLLLAGDETPGPVNLADGSAAAAGLDPAGAEASTSDGSADGGVADLSAADPAAADPGAVDLGAERTDATEPDPVVVTATATAPTARAAAGTTSSAAKRAATSPRRTATPTATKRTTTTRSATPAPTTTSAGASTSSGGSSSGTGRIRFGVTYTGVATFYGADGGGACSFEPGSDRMVAAMNHTDYENSQACGAFVAVTGPSGTTVTVRIVDECPECAAGAIDLSAEAFAKLAAPSAGRIPISWKLTGPALSGPVSYVYKTGSSQYWCGIQVRNHRNPIRALAVKVNGAWTSLPRAEYNYFLSEGGAGCGSDLRITDIYGNQLTDSGIAIRPDTVQQGKAQFPAP